MNELHISIHVIVALFFIAFVVILLLFFIRIIKQNNLVMKSADHRLDRANEMVLTLAHSSDELSNSISQLKEMMVHLEGVYTSRTDMVIKNRDEFREAYIKLLEKYNELNDKHDACMKESYAVLKELARRPTITNTTGSE